MKDIQQLIKKNSQEGRYEDIFPKTFTDAVKDKESGKSLIDILSSFNMYFLSYNGSRALTRLQVPLSLRKTGLWITYVLYDKTVVTEWYAGEAIDDDSWKSSNNWRVGTNMLVGDISISSDGYWVVNGVVTTTKAQGEQGITPILRVRNNHLQVSYTNGSSWIDVSEFTNSLHIKGYAATIAALPSSAVQGDIYGVGPTYDPSDTGQTNPIYQLYVKDSTGWVNNGKFTSIAAGVVQTTGTSTTEVMSQDAVSKKFAQVETDLNTLSAETLKDINTLEDYSVNYKLNNYKPGTSYIIPFKLNKGVQLTVNCVTTDTFYVELLNPATGNYWRAGEINSGNDTVVAKRDDIDLTDIRLYSSSANVGGNAAFLLTKKNEIKPIFVEMQADIDALENAVTDLENSMITEDSANEIIGDTMFSKALQNTVVTDVLYENYNGDVGALVPLTNYKSVVFYADSKLKIYFDSIPTNTYYSILYAYNNNGTKVLLGNPNAGSAYVLNADVKARVRKSESNLPTSSNPLVLPKDALIIITVKMGETAYYSNEITTTTLNNTINLNTNQLSQAINGFPKCVVKKESNTRIGVYSQIKGDRYIYYPIVRQINSGINLDYWKLFNCYECTYLDGEFTLGNLVIWGNQGENEFVFKIVDGIDHIGGYHGDEVYTSAYMYIDGLQYLPEDIPLNIICNNFRYSVKSNMYGNSIGDADAVAVHYKTTYIQDGGYKTDNRVTFLKALNLEKIYTGLVCMGGNVSEYWTCNDMVVRQKLNNNLNIVPTINVNDSRIDYWNPTTKLAAWVDSKVVYGFDQSKFRVVMWDRGAPEPDVKYYNVTYANYPVAQNFDGKVSSEVRFYIQD